MMLDPSTRLLIAYRLIALLALAAAAAVLWRRHDMPDRRREQERTRSTAHTRRRQPSVPAANDRVLS
jgi:hypothetical protein